MAAWLRWGLAGLLLTLLSGCGLWDSEEEIEPAALPDISAEYELRKLWSSQVGDGLGEKYHQFIPAVLADRIFAADHEGSVFALDRNNGDKIWNQELELPLSGGVGVGDGRVVVSTEDGQAVALSALDGNEVWRARLSSEAVSPAAIGAGVVLLQTIDGRLVALDNSDGSLRWSYSAQEPKLTLRGTSSPVIVDNGVLAGFSSGKVIALSLESGEVLWETRVANSEGRTELERMVDIDGSLLTEQGLVYAGSYQGRLTAMVMADGRRVWSEPLSSFRSLTHNSSQIFAVDDEGSVIAFDKRSGTELWKQAELYYRQVGTPAVIDGVVAVGDFEGYVHLLAPEDGRFVGRYRVDSSALLAPPLSIDGVLYTLSDGGRLSALQLQSK